ncbi:hypothetical protein [Bacillus marinisedimentorum]|uniref:hypothetical protein n=1 Tax=Bacillus marinisedimentorum TaxID=1821260 RepID=UPI0014718356|nr:hypothetical protein [Bacillus marinisedimentorum]
MIEYLKNTLLLNYNYGINKVISKNFVMHGKKRGGVEVKPTQKPVYFDGSGSASNPSAGQSAAGTRKAAITPEMKKNLGGNPYNGTNIKK